MELINHKLIEKFRDIKKAFLFFDQHKRMRISYEDFAQALENMSVKISCNESFGVFQYIDKQQSFRD